MASFLSCGSKPEHHTTTRGAKTKTHKQHTAKATIISERQPAVEVITSLLRVELRLFWPPRTGHARILEAWIIFVVQKLRNNKPTNPVANIALREREPKLNRLNQTNALLISLQANHKRETASNGNIDQANMHIA